MRLARADIVGNVWKVVAREGDEVMAGDVVCVLETMKMEIPIAAPVSGHISQIHVSEGDIVAQGDAIAEIDETACA
jgi:acetyl-CoA carboxylase biotin carboxyl carrier protein